MAMIPCTPIIGEIKKVIYTMSADVTVQAQNTASLVLKTSENLDDYEPLGMISYNCGSVYLYPWFNSGPTTASNKYDTISINVANPFNSAQTSDHNYSSCTMMFQKNLSKV